MGTRIYHADADENADTDANADTDVDTNGIRTETNMIPFTFDGGRKNRQTKSKQGKFELKQRRETM